MNLKVSDARKQDGFTLIELLVVVIIIGILAAIAIPVFLNQRERAWRSSAESDARNAAIQVETVGTRTGDFPDEGDLTTEITDLQASDGVGLYYLYTSGATNYVLCAVHDNVEDEMILYDSDGGGLGDWVAYDATTCGTELVAGTAETW